LSRHAAYGDYHGVVAGRHIGHMRVDLVESRAWHTGPIDGGVLPPIMTVTGLATMPRFCTVTTPPSGYAGVVGPKPVAQKATTSPGFANYPC